jgi:hypothetical protein
MRISANRIRASVYLASVSAADIRAVRLLPSELYLVLDSHIDEI